MPPSMRDWLPQDHLVLFVADVVDDLDLSAFYATIAKTAAAERPTTPP